DAGGSYLADRLPPVFHPFGPPTPRKVRQPMSKYSLADIKADMDKLFAPVTLDLGKEEIVLRNILRVDDAARTKVVEAQKRIQELADEDGEVDDDHMVEYKAQMLAVLAAVATDGE